MLMVLDNISCDLDPEVKVKGQKSIFFLNLRTLQLKSFQMNRSHDVEGAAQKLI